MSDIKKKIRQEIERRAKFHNDAMKACAGLNHIALTHSAGWKEDSELLAFIDSLPEEKPSEDLEEAAQEYAIPFNDTTYGCEYSYKGFIAGAKWQAKQLLKSSPLPEDTVLFKKGVEEGRRLEKDDLALSIDDIEKIHVFLYAVKNNKQGAFTFTRLSDEQYKEVLQRFRNFKNK